MNITSCEDLLRLFSPTESMSYIIHVILPQMCGLIDTIGANVTKEEELFHNHCCNPIPTMILNRTVHFYGENETTTDVIVRDVCNYMSANPYTREEKLYRELCVNATIMSRGILNPAYQMLTYIILSLLSPIGLFANMLILLTVYKIKHLRNTTGYFICNLAIADLLVIFEMLLFLVLNKTGVMQSANPRARTFFFPTLDVFLGSASLLHVTAVTIERGIAVSMPLRYPRYLNERTANKVIIGIWVYCFIMFILGTLRICIISELYEKIFFYTAITLSFFIPCVLVLISYSFILVSALNNMKMEKKISKVIVVISMMDRENLEQVTSMRPARFREIKIALNVAVMTVPFVCGWGYFAICHVYEIVSRSDIDGFQNWLIPLVPFIISCLNPLTYLMFTRSLRKSSVVLLSRSRLCKKLTQSFIRRESVVTSISFVINDRSTTSYPEEMRCITEDTNEVRKESSGSSVIDETSSALLKTQNGATSVDV